MTFHSLYSVGCHFTMTVKNHLKIAVKLFREKSKTTSKDREYA